MDYVLASLGEAVPADRAPVPVTVATVKKMDLSVEIASFGRVLPVATVSVKARVSSLVTEVKIADGQRVKNGDVLFILDSAPFAAAVAKAKATLAHDQALADNAEIEDKRQLALLKQRAISQDAYDSVHTSYLAAVATRDMSAADLKTAELRLGYCEIASPLDGVVGRVEVKAGNLIGENDVEMVSINQLMPIRVSFSAPENRLADIRSAIGGGASVQAFAADGGGKSVGGALVFIDNQVDSATGTIALEAEFANADAILWPGQYTRTVLRLSLEKGVLAVPEQALHPVADGSYMAAVAKSDGTVEMRTCKVERLRDGLAVVSRGLAEGESVVLDGYVRLTKDSRVQIKAPAEAGSK